MFIFPVYLLCCADLLVSSGGSDEYARITRSWQALCLLSRFVTEDIAQHVADKAFSALANNLHGEIR